VIRAAISEVEDFTRVDLVTIDEVRVSGHAVNDVVHLLAELIENATTFSPPETPVRIAGQITPNGHLVEIEDCGLGMSDEQLAAANERIANPPMIDFALSRMLGFFVVGRLAQRYGIKVQLRRSWYEGVTALVLLPRTLLIQPGATEMSRLGELQQDGRYAQLPPASAPAMAGASVGPSADLPIFEATRSEQFAGPPPTTAHPPLGSYNGFQSDLPRRAPRTNMAPGLANAAPPSAPPGGPSSSNAQPRRQSSGLTRSPDDIRAMLTSYRTGLMNGRNDALNERRGRRAPDPSNSPFSGGDYDARH
jgi:hypothetical protein